MLCGYISKENPFEDRFAWSGIIYKVREAIENAGVEVKWIPFNDQKRNRVLDFILRKCSSHQLITGHTPWSSYNKAKSIDRSLLKDCDFLFLPNGSEIIPYIDTDLPIIAYGDTTYHLMLDYYYHDVSWLQAKLGEVGERKAVKKADVVCKSSHWAIDSVIRDYGGNPDHAYVLEFCANIDESDICPITPYTGEGRLNIFFSGVDWNRKGGDLAVKTVECLIASGINAKLVICGISQLPDVCRTKDFIVNYGFLNKNIPRDYQTYLEVFRSAHIFLLPTKAECAGIVFSEASAFGLPIYTHDTGGIGDYVINDVNGYRLPLGSRAEDFARKILDTLSPETQQRLHQGGLEVYGTRLGWRNWSRKFRVIVEKEITNRPIHG